MADAGVLIVGGGQGAAQAAHSLRQAGYAGAITIAGEEAWPPYQRPPLSKAFLLGEIEAERLAAKPAAFYADNDIVLATGARANLIDRSEREVWFAGGARRRYETLILATGARPIALPAPGADLDGVVTLRTRADSADLRERMARAQRVAVIGGGYIGLETAAAARKMGRAAVVIEAAPRLLARVAGPKLAQFYLRTHEAHGVEVRVGAKAARLEGRDGRLTAVVLESGEHVEADLAVVGIGVAPNVELAQAAGLVCENGIVTDEAGRTVDPNVFAIGDCATAWNPIYERSLRYESVQNALDGAKAAAAAISGKPAPAAAAPWNWSDQYDVKLQIAGLSQGADATVLRGELETGSFALFHLQASRLIGCDAVNSGPEFMAARQLIARRARIAPETLRDTSIPIKSIAQAA